MRTVRLDRSVIGAPQREPARAAGTPAEGAELTVADDGEWVRADGATYTYAGSGASTRSRGRPARLPVDGGDVGHQVAVEVTAATTAGETVELSPGSRWDRAACSSWAPEGGPPPRHREAAGGPSRAGRRRPEGRRTAARLGERRAADRVTLDVRPKGGLLRRLRRRGRAPVRARVTYDPLTGESESAVKRITLRLRRKR